MSANKYLELMSILLNIFQMQKLMNKNHEGRELIFEGKKDKRHEKKTQLQICQN